MATAHILGFPRIGAQRELKLALDACWRNAISESELLAAGRELRARHWRMQRDAGLDFVTVGDFAWYDHVLQTLAHLGCAPGRFGFGNGGLSLQEYFSLARGTAAQPAMELTKWFDTNYHYLVPEWDSGTRFGPGVDWLVEEIGEARALGYRVKAALLGPLSLLHLGKSKGPGAKGAPHAFDRLDLLPRLLPAYQALLSGIRAAGAEWVQIDEPVLALDAEQRLLDAFPATYEALAGVSPKILLATFFGAVDEHAPLLKSLAVSGLHLDLVRGHAQLAAFLSDWPDGKVLSLGVVNGRNVWRTDVESVLGSLREASVKLGENLWVSASCSLLHVPTDLTAEKKLDPALRSKLAFAAQKLYEIVAIKRAVEERELHAAPSPAFHNPKEENTPAEDARRASPFAVRIEKQRARLNLPLLPTTTIGSFPQTARIRKSRAAYRRGEIAREQYVAAMQAEIRDVIERQERLGLDVLVHGEAERNDMVEYFGEQLGGFAFTEHGWVQSYGSRCVKPPLIHADVSRPAPMTVEWLRYAQGLTAKPVKGMLTGPITMLQWSFVREDQPRSRTALQLAAALRDEVLDLERAGAALIQIDEPALREGLPLRKSDWPVYLDWAVRAFRLASCAVADETQIHTHMCYAEFNDILPAIAAMDADVITIETSRSDMELLEGFGAFHYPNEIGPGVYDIHSPRVPAPGDMVRLMEKALQVIPAGRLWINPDCGLKTRNWPEVEAALGAMVEAAALLRKNLEMVNCITSESPSID
jgi:5-methyltetrahydropteroyltriglutamate--homocysteine methyltransferase